MFDFDWTIRAGDVFTMGGAAMLALGIVYNRGRSESRLEQILTRTADEVKDMKLELKGLAQVVTKQAVQDERLNAQSQRINLIEGRLEDLRHGRGIVEEGD